MTQTAWSHLPNAKHIDWVIASAKKHPKKWAIQSKRYQDDAWQKAWQATWRKAKDLSRISIWHLVWEAAGNLQPGATRVVMAALVAYDDCAYMIESDVDELKLLAALGDPKAKLLLPACIVYNETKALI